MVQKRELSEIDDKKGNFLENDFLTPLPSYQFSTFCIIDYVAAALGPIAYPSRRARPRSLA